MFADPTLVCPSKTGCVFILTTRSVIPDSGCKVFSTLIIGLRTATDVPRGKTTVLSVGFIILIGIVPLESTRVLAAITEYCLTTFRLISATPKVGAFSALLPLPLTMTMHSDLAGSIVRSTVSSLQLFSSFTGCASLLHSCAFLNETCPSFAFQSRWYLFIKSNPRIALAVLPISKMRN